MLYSMFILWLIIAVNYVNSLNVTDVETTCRSMYTSGYGYHTFFHIPQSGILNDGSIYMNFSVMAPSNAHILLSPKSSPSDKDLVYEIVLGAGKNTFSSIRKLRTTMRVSINTPNILNEEALKHFWLTAWEGVINVGHEDGKPILHLEDVNPLEVNYISFGAWVGVTATWVYDCKNTTTQGPLNKYDRLDASRRLKFTLLENYDPFTLPINSDELIITAAAEVFYADLDLKKAILTTYLNFNFTWTDLKMSWIPSQFNNVTSFNLYYPQIWKPDIFIYNSVLDGSMRIKNNVITVENNGRVQWIPSVELITSCASNTTFWPSFQHVCPIRVGFHPYSIPTRFILGSRILKLQPFKTGTSSWDLGDINISLDDSNQDERVISNNSNIFLINIQLERHSTPFIYMFLLPIICAVIMSQFTFILPPYCSSRIYLQLISMVIFTIYLLVAVNNLPPQQITTSFIVEFCSKLLMLVSVQILITVFLLNFAKINYQYPVPNFIRRLLGNKAIRTILLLPQNINYNELEESTNNYVKKFESNWIMFSIILDRIILFISLLIIVTPIIIAITGNQL